MNKIKKQKTSPTGHIELGPYTSMKLSSRWFSDKVLRGLRSLQQEESLCDYTLIAGDRRVKVHRAVMAACSDYFRVMMTGSMKESQEDSVHLQGVSATGLEAVIDFAYTGDMVLDNDSIESILAASVHLQMQDAVDLCCEFLNVAISPDNCVEILNLTDLYSLPSHSIWDYILENFDNIAGTDQFFKLSLDQMTGFLQSNNLKVMSEYRLFELVLKWMNFDPETREQHIAELMQHVRLPLLSGEELVEKVSCVDIMIKNKACFDLLNEAKDYHIVTSKRPMLQTSRTRVRSQMKSLVLSHAETVDAFNLDTRRNAFLKDVTVPVYNPCVCVVDNFMYVCGGKYDRTESNDIATARCFRYDPQFDTWFETASMNEARKDFLLLAYDKQLFAIGGQDETLLSSTIECYSITNNEWDCTTMCNDAAKFSAAGAVCGNYIYCSGGRVDHDYSPKLLRYDPVADSWEDKAQMIQARANHVMECVGKCLYVIGGNVADIYGFSVPIMSIECYNVEHNQWTLCKSTINVHEAGSCIDNGTIYIVGGINEEHYFSDLIQAYNTVKDSTEIIERLPTRIHGKACCILTLPMYV